MGRGGCTNGGEACQSVFRAWPTQRKFVHSVRAEETPRPRDSRGSRPRAFRATPRGAGPFVVGPRFGGGVLASEEIRSGRGGGLGRGGPGGRSAVQRGDRRKAPGGRCSEAIGLLHGRRGTAF